MTAWQRRLRLALALFTAGLAIALVTLLRQGRAPAPPPSAILRRDANVVAESTAGRSVRLLGAKPDISVEHYDTMTQYADGRTRLTGVVVRVPQRGGRDFVARADAAEVRGQPPDQDVRLTGAVEITTSDGLSAQTGEAAYDHATGTIDASGAIRFAGRGLAGRAVGLRYEQARDLLTLLDRVVVRRDAGPDGEPSLEVEAGSASFARGDKTLRFHGGVRLVRGGQTMTAAELTAGLDPAGRRLRRLDLHGRSQVEGQPRGNGGLAALRGEDIGLSYADDGRTLQRATVDGGGLVEMAGGPAGGGQRLAGPHIDIGLGPDGAGITSILASGGVTLELPPEASGPARTIQAAVLQASGDPAGGLRAAAFDGHVEYRESWPAGGPARSASSSTLALVLGHDLGRVESARFGGGVTFVQGSLTATAREAQYEPATARLRLSGGDSQPAQVSEDQVVAGAERIEVHLDGRRFTAEGSVKTVSRAGTPPRSPGGGTSARVPGVLDAGQPVRVAAGRLVYDDREGRAEYAGGVALWQDRVAIRADRVVVDQQRGSLLAEGHVVSRMALGRPAAAPAGAQAATTASAERMEYDDDARRLRYTGGARLSGPEGDLAAAGVAVFLRAGSREMERMEADGTVTLRTENGRLASGRRLVYRTEGEQYDLLGQPAGLEDETGKTTGNSLTFYRSAATIIVDGTAQKRTELQRGIKR
jgi:lipopolysaccharide transport protein LptA